ncbi:histidinol-phosphate aminotransferase [Sphingopyxis panaciterrae]|uniref:pyridoxal phosphate-dependent aminotransferase n=1 Tax=Sphingopyxis panaciterrae TaxID=363841 RepID=UPI001FBB711C|nr:histidinol-phosphate transaminase [Sphingopyxis panaciterrae]NIJ37497.1 histidinol-phosphate aminotransferase [Sphingopyxis panaciterrae]
MVGAMIGEGHGGFTRRDWLAATGMAAVAIAVPGTSNAKAASAAPIRLNLNESAFGPSPKVAKAIEATLGNIARYVEQPDVDRLAEQIARHEGVAAGQVVIGEVLEPLGLYLARQRKGEGNVVYSAPGYTALIDAAAPLGGVGKPVPLNARLENDLPALLAAIDAETLAVNLVNPHNPSGTVNEAAAFDRFLAEASARTLVVVDEAYLEYDDLAARSAIRQLRTGANILIFRTLAKAYGLAGLSIGYAIAPAPLAKGLRDAGIGAPHSLSRLNLAAGSAALADQAYIARVRAWTLAGRKRLEQTIDALSLDRTDSRANFVYFRTPTANALRAEAAKRNILIGRAFPPLDDWVRITVGTPGEVQAVVKLLGDTVKPRA